MWFGDEHKSDPLSESLTTVSFFLELTSLLSRGENQWVVEVQPCLESAFAGIARQAKTNDMCLINCATSAMELGLVSLCSS